LRDLNQLDRSAQVLREAVRRQGVALDLRPKNRVFRDLCCNHHAQLADTLLVMGRAIEAVAVARKLPDLAPDDPAMLFRAASLYAGCAARARRCAGLPWGIGLLLARTYQSESVALARRAVANGLADASRKLSAPAFDPLRNCEEFRVLIQEVTAPKQ
jgi:hypothetical protein